MPLYFAQLMEVGPYGVHGRSVVQHAGQVSHHVTGRVTNQPHNTMVMIVMAIQLKHRPVISYHVQVQQPLHNSFKYITKSIINNNLLHILYIKRTNFL